MLWFSCSISSTSNNILCISMKQKNLGNVISVIMLMHYKKVFKSMFEIVIQKKAISKFVTSVVTRPQSTTTWKNTLSVLTRKKDGSPVTCAMHISIAKALWNATSEVIFFLLLNIQNNISSFPAFPPSRKSWTLLMLDSLLSSFVTLLLGEFDGDDCQDMNPDWSGIIIGDGNCSLVNGKPYPLLIKIDLFWVRFQTTRPFQCLLLPWYMMDVVRTIH